MHVFECIVLLVWLMVLSGSLLCCDVGNNSPIYFESKENTGVSMLLVVFMSNVLSVCLLGPCHVWLPASDPSKSLTVVAEDR